jgi:hypothetical protein
MSAVTPMDEHSCRKPTHNWEVLHVKIAHHGITLSSSQYPDVVDINVAAQESHGAVRAQGASADLESIDVRTLIIRGRGIVKYIHHILGIDQDSSSRSIVRCQRGICI